MMRSTVKSYRYSKPMGSSIMQKLAGNDYSVNPTAIDQLVDVRTTLAQVTVSRAGHLLATHDRWRYCQDLWIGVSGNLLIGG